MPHMQYAFMRANYPVLLALETQLRITIMNMDDQQRVLTLREDDTSMVWNANQNHSKAERKAAEIASALLVRQAHSGSG